MNLSLASARDALLAGLFGDARQADHARPSFALDMLSDWLPYRVYDEGPGLYRNAHSKGFVLEVTPLIGADERTGEILGQSRRDNAVPALSRPGGRLGARGLQVHPSRRSAHAGS